MPTVKASGTLSASSSEQDLSSPVYNGANVLTLDLNALGDGDQIVVRVYRSVLPTGTQRLLLEEAIGFQQKANAPIVQFSPVSMPFGGRISLQQPIGSGKSIPWELSSLGEVFVEASGTVTLNGTTETALVTSTSGKLVTCILDLSAIGSDLLRFRSKREVLSGNTRRVYQEHVWTGLRSASEFPAALGGTNGQELWQAIPYLATYGAEFSLQRPTNLLGSGNLQIPYSIESFDE